MTDSNTVAALIRRTKNGRDRYNQDQYSETATTFAAIYAPGGSSEQVNGQDTVTIQPTVYAPTGTDVSAIDAVIPQVVVDDNGDPVLDEDGLPQGDRYEVDGQATVWPPNPFGGFQSDYSVEIRLKRSTG